MFTTHHYQVTQNTMAMHGVCSTADDQPVHDNNTSTYAGSQHVIWLSDTKPSCYTGRHRHGMHRTSHRDISSAYTDSYLPLTMKLVNSFIISKLVLLLPNLPTVVLYSNMSIMHSTFSSFLGNTFVQGAVGHSTRIFWSGIIRRSGTCIGREQAPDRVLPVDFPTRLTHPLP